MGVGIFRPLLYDYSPFPFPPKVVGHKVLFKLTFHLVIKRVSGASGFSSEHNDDDNLVFIILGVNEFVNRKP